LKIQDLSNSNIYYDQKKCFGIVSKSEYLTPSKFLIDHKSFKLQQSRIIPVVYHNEKITSSVKLLSNSDIIIFQFNCDFDINDKSFVIKWKKSDFECLACKSTYNNNNRSEQCCSLIDAPLRLFDAKIESITLSPSNYLDEIKQSKLDFIGLHFSSILDTIII
jgi:hypothetical protein